MILKPQKVNKMIDIFTEKEEDEVEDEPHGENIANVIAVARAKQSRQTLLTLLKV